MSHGFFTTILIQPIYNVFVYLIDFFPGHSAGLAIITLTVFLRLVFYPIFAQGMRTQYAMKRIEGQMEEIKIKYKGDAALRGKKTMELLKVNNIRPFFSFLALLIQLPVFIALYFVFLREGFPAVALDLLYSFTPVPETIATVFLGLLDLTAKHNIILSIIVGAAQFAQSYVSQMSITIPANIPPERAQMMNMQRKMMIYFIPLLMMSVTYTLPGAPGLYILTNALASLVQELIVRRRFLHESLPVVEVA